MPALPEGRDAPSSPLDEEELDEEELDEEELEDEELLDGSC